MQMWTWRQVAWAVALVVGTSHGWAQTGNKPKAGELSTAVQVPAPADFRHDNLFSDAPVSSTPAAKPTTKVSTAAQSQVALPGKPTALEAANATHGSPVNPGAAKAVRAVSGQVTEATPTRAPGSVASTALGEGHTAAKNAVKTGISSSHGSSNLAPAATKSVVQDAEQARHGHSSLHGQTAAKASERVDGGARSATRHASALEGATQTKAAAKPAEGGTIKQGRQEALPKREMPHGTQHAALAKAHPLKAAPTPTLASSKREKPTTLPERDKAKGVVVHAKPKHADGIPASGVTVNQKAGARLHASSAQAVSRETRASMRKGQGGASSTAGAKSVKAGASAKLAARTKPTTASTKSTHSVHPAPATVGKAPHGQRTVRTERRRTNAAHG